MSKVLTESNAKVTTPSASLKNDSIKSKGAAASASPSKRGQSSINRKSSSLSASPTIKNRAVGGVNSGSSLIEKSKKSLNIDTKENDVAVEINITTGSNVQVNE